MGLGVVLGPPKPRGAAGCGVTSAGTRWCCHRSHRCSGAGLGVVLSNSCGQFIQSAATY